MNKTISAVKTQFRGTVFRSKSEAVLAKCLFDKKIPYEYEPLSKGKDNVCGFGNCHDWDFCIKGYDSRVRNFNVYVEYKPSKPSQQYIDNLIDKLKEWSALGARRDILNLINYGYSIDIIEDYFGNESIKILGTDPEDSPFLKELSFNKLTELADFVSYSMRPYQQKTGRLVSGLRSIGNCASFAMIVYGNPWDSVKNNSTDGVYDSMVLGVDSIQNRQRLDFYVGEDEIIKIKEKGFCGITKEIAASAMNHRFDLDQLPPFIEV